MIFSRQKVLLCLLHQLGGHEAGTDFQKLLLLFTKEWEANPSYDFVPYKFGGFSFTSYADRRKLIAEGYLEDDDAEWILKAEGRKAAVLDADLSRRVGGFVRRHGALRGMPLVTDTYKRYPYLATRSEILAKALPDAKDRKAVESARPLKKPAGLVTIGYEGKSLESYLNQLLMDGVTVLCDVRRNPLSRKYGFSKKTLSHACEGVGIRYEHLPELGIDSEDRKELKTQADYDTLFESYERDWKPGQAAAVERIHSWIAKDGLRVALTCFELHPQQCHRHCVADALQRCSHGKLMPLHL